MTRNNSRSLWITFATALVAVTVWELASGVLLPESNLAYTSGVISWLFNLLMTAVIVGLAAHVGGRSDRGIRAQSDGGDERSAHVTRPYPAGGRYLYVLVSAVGALSSPVGYLIYYFVTQPRDGQDGMYVFYVLLFYPIVAFIGGWVVVAIVDRLRPKAKAVR